MRNALKGAAVTMLGLTCLLAQACATQHGSGSGEEYMAGTERVDEATIKHIPPAEFSMTASRPKPSVRAELAARNATGLAHGSLLDVWFDFDESAIRPDALPVLQANAKRLLADGVTRLLLEGRGDEAGTAAYNLVLGDRRAKRVKMYLEDLGLIVEFKTVSYGKDRPLCFDHSTDCYQKNRSVHFVVK